MEYQRYIRNRQIERARELLKKMDPETFKKGPHDVTRFVKRNSQGKNGEKAADPYILNQELIAKEEKYDGFYAIATNLDDDAQTIIDISSRRHRIEDCFRVMKTNFSGRPVYHHNRERITAHFMICYTALLIYRLLEKKLDDAGEHFITAQIIETLQNLKVAQCQRYVLHGDIYRLPRINSAEFDLSLGFGQKTLPSEGTEKKLKEFKSDVSKPQTVTDQKRRNSSNRNEFRLFSFFQLSKTGFTKFDVQYKSRIY